VRLEDAREALERRRAEVSEELAELTAVPRDPMEAVSFGKRVGDGTTQAVERLNQVGTATALAAMLEDVDRALVKLDEGSYGRCDSCGAEIPEERLEARPWSVLCVTCSAAR
jgi:RNA polymerase-binding transcription factor